MTGIPTPNPLCRLQSVLISAELLTLTTGLFQFSFASLAASGLCLAPPTFHSGLTNPTQGTSKKHHSCTTGSLPPKLANLMRDRNQAHIFSLLSHQVPLTMNIILLADLSYQSHH